MTRRIAILGVCGAAGAIAQQGVDNTQFTSDLLSFHKAYNQFFRSYFGCPADTPYPSDCTPNVGTFDAAMWKECTQRAPKIFNYPKP